MDASSSPEGPERQTQPRIEDGPSQEPRRESRLVLDIAPEAILKVLLSVGAVLVLMRLGPVLIDMGLALMVVATFNPVVRRLQRYLTRRWAIATILGGLILTGLLVSALIVPLLVRQVIDLIQNAPAYTRRLQEIAASHHLHVNVQRQVEQLSSRLALGLPSLIPVLNSLVSGVAGLAGLIFLSIYLLIESNTVGSSLLRLVPVGRRAAVHRLIADLEIHVGGYVRGQLINSALVGIYSSLVLFAVGAPEALALGALAAVVDVIPLVGVLIATIPAALVALTVSPTRCFIVLVCYLLYHQLEGNVIGPRVYGNTLHLSLTAVIVSILVGYQLLGFVGTIFALPVAAAIPAIIRFVEEWQSGGSDSARSIVS